MKYIKERKIILVKSRQDLEELRDLVGKLHDSDYLKGHEVLLDDKSNTEEMRNYLASVNFSHAHTRVHFRKELDDIDPGPVALPEGFEFKDFSKIGSEPYICLIEDEGLESFLSQPPREMIEGRSIKSDFNPIQWQIITHQNEPVAATFCRVVDGNSQVGIVSFMCVKKSFQGQGLGTLLVKQSINILKELGAKYYDGATLSTNTSMIGAFDSSGCQRMGNRYLWTCC